MQDSYVSIVIGYEQRDMAISTSQWLVTSGIFELPSKGRIGRANLKPFPDFCKFCSLANSWIFKVLQDMVLLPPVAFMFFVSISGLC